MTHDTAMTHALDTARAGLLDLSGRNRLLNTPRGRTRASQIEIVDELTAEVFKRLLLDKKSMTFSAASAEIEEEPAADQEVILTQPEERESDGAAERRSDSKLQTTLPSDKLQKRLLKLYYDARTCEQEQGVNILFLAVGFLKWFESESSDKERFAPLILIPVQLERTTARSKFKLSFTQEELSTNLSLQSRLKEDFGIELPELPEAEDLTPADYFQAVSQAVAGQDRWEVLPNDMVLSLFSFAKFLMYRDLDPANWPQDSPLTDHPVVSAMLRDGFSPAPPLCNDQESIDPLLPPHNLVHVLDADSSQTIAIEEVKRGRSLVIEGPPGTGKSQTIANMIAAAVKAGKTVLFVAEKMAALDVVKRRLEKVELGELCLELHSHKANKQAVLRELERTLKLKKPRSADINGHCDRLLQVRNRLNDYLDTIHTPLTPSQKTPYQVIGEMVRLQARGTALPDFSLQDATAWTAEDFGARRRKVEELAERLKAIGIPVEHVWRGVREKAMLPADVQRVINDCSSLQERLQQLQHASEQLAERLDSPFPNTLHEVAQQALLARRLQAAPPMDRQSLAHRVWAEQRTRIDELVAEGQGLRQRQTSLEGRVVDVAWQTDLQATRRSLAAHGRSLFRWFNRSYREAQATLAGITAGPPPKSLDDRLHIVDEVLRVQNAKQSLNSEAACALGTAAFGLYWHGERTDWDAVSKITAWEGESRDAGLDDGFRQRMANLTEPEGLREPLLAIRELLKPLVAQFKELFAKLSLDVSAAFPCKDLVHVPLEDLAIRLQAWQDYPEELSKWSSYFVAAEKLTELGGGELVARLHDGRIPAGEAIQQFDFAYYELLSREVYSTLPELPQFDGASHEQVLQEFRQLDLFRIQLARVEVAEIHYEQLAGVKAGQHGEIGLVQREINKKARHLPIRQLLTKAGRAVQRIKPVFMMSPISIAQFLEPGKLEFDLLLIDEASQVEPADGLGAAARAKQIVVVGDSKQLPPTQFFNKATQADGEEDAEDDFLDAGDMESILSLCRSQQMPDRKLLWHYRSQHHSLIALSNQEFYDNELFVVPSPGDPVPGCGLIFHHVQEGVFDRGGSATNRIEARRVAEKVMEHARLSPGQTLGVAAFSSRQRDAILDEVELLRREHPELESFFITASDEPFFVKNLENVQGDERDVIFISIGYGKDASGYLTMHFGPLSNKGGERRLNVLITRARESCHVFSSIVAEDIDTTRATGAGPRVFKEFLKYAATGLLRSDEGSQANFESEFERQVAQALATQGIATRPQVGVAGFFVDLAVIDPEQPGRYLLGIECDGANYHRSRSARDRDRLRQAVLESRGWTIHRIWSTDWFHRPEAELKKVLEAIEEAKLERSGPADTGAEKAEEESLPPTLSIARVEEPEEMTLPHESLHQPYVVSSFRVNSRKAIHETSKSQLAKVVEKIIELEGPIHREVIQRRVVELWGLKRTGKRIREAVDRALESLERHRVQCVDGDFYLSPALSEIPVRDRAAVDDPRLKKPELLPPSEIRAALRAVIAVNFGMTHDAALGEVASLIGFQATSAQLKEIIGRELQRLVDSQEIESREGQLYPSPTTKQTAV